MPQIRILLDSPDAVRLVKAAFDYVNDSSVIVVGEGEDYLVIEDADQDYDYTMDWRSKWPSRKCSYS